MHPVQQSQWVMATPDMDVEVGDLAAHRVVPLPRGRDFPARLAAELYAFDAPISEADLAGVRAAGRALAAAMGVTLAQAIAPTGAEWLFADPGHEKFGKPVDDALMAAGDTAVIREGSALVLYEEEWTFAERVETEQREAWVREKQNGPGRDPRVGPVVTGPGGKRSRSLREALDAAKEYKAPDWPFQGPRAISELLQSVLAAGVGIAQFHNNWVTKSGVAAGGGLAHEHRHLLDIIGLLVTYDMLDVGNISGAELAARRALQIERAVRKNPRFPDFVGLEVMLSHALDDSGGVVCSAYDRWVAEEQRAQAQVLKQYRLWSEEQGAQSHGGGQGGGRGGGGGGDGGGHHKNEGGKDKDRKGGGGGGKAAGRGRGGGEPAET